MIIDLEPYQAELPYPELHKVQPDKSLADRLMAGYSGEASELTTILQYAYHSVKLQKRFGKISDMIRGIFYVESLHMKHLGNCIIKLGGEPLYTVSLRERTIDWQSGFVDYESMPAQMLAADIRGEQGAIEFYEKTAAEIDQPDVSALLLRLAEDEKLHLRMFTEIYQRNFK